jgi:hypothetical protein
MQMCRCSGINNTCLICNIIDLSHSVFSFITNSIYWNLIIAGIKMLNELCTLRRLYLLFTERPHRKNA